MNVWRRLAVFAAITLLSGCEGSSSTPEYITTTGVSLNIRADRPLDSQVTTVAASAYLDGKLRPLVGGDLFYAKHDEDEQVLRFNKDIQGLYQGTLNHTDTASLLEVDIRFQPEVARNERWYPTDALSVTSTAGRLVGYSASASFPPAIRINEPAENTLYQSLNNEVIITWDTQAGDHMIEIISDATCHSGSYSLQFSRRFNARDDGHFSTPLITMIPPDELINLFSLDLFVLQFATAVYLPILFDVLTLGLYDLKPIKPEPFVTEFCDFDLQLYRVRTGTLSEGVNGGAMKISRSHNIRARYQP